MIVNLFVSYLILLFSSFNKGRYDEKYSGHYYNCRPVDSFHKIWNISEPVVDKKPGSDRDQSQASYEIQIKQKQEAYEYQYSFTPPRFSQSLNAVSRATPSKMKNRPMLT
jgi:hypothetical protein